MITPIKPVTLEDYLAKAFKNVMQTFSDVLEKEERLNEEKLLSPTGKVAGE